VCSDEQCSILIRTFASLQEETPDSSVVTRLLKSSVTELTTRLLTLEADRSRAAQRALAERSPGWQQDQAAPSDFGAREARTKVTATRPEYTWFFSN
jgi:hypothetical protein